MKLIRWTIFGVIPLTLIVTPVIIALNILEKTPATTKRQTVSTADVSRARAIGREAVDKLLNSNKKAASLSLKKNRWHDRPRDKSKRKTFRQSQFASIRPQYSTNLQGAAEPSWSIC
jgi:hypothetical protein